MKKNTVTPKRTMMDFQPSPRKAIEWRQVGEPIVCEFIAPPDDDHPDPRTFQINGVYGGEFFNGAYGAVSLLKFGHEERMRAPTAKIPAGLYAKPERFKFLREG